MRNIFIYFLCAIKTFFNILFYRCKQRCQKLTNYTNTDLNILIPVKDGLLTAIFKSTEHSRPPGSVPCLMKLHH